MLDPADRHPCAGFGRPLPGIPWPEPVIASAKSVGSLLKGWFSMRHFKRLCMTILILSLAAGSVLAASVPVPGVGVVIKKHPGSSHARFGTGDLPAIPADFFGPGSLPFEGLVGLQGPCELPCDPCNCNDLRIDYSMDSASGPFDTEMVALTLHSTAPIVVGNLSGVDSFFDVWVEISAVGGGSPVTGGLSIEPGTALLPGTTSFVVDSFFDIEYRISFSEPGSLVRLPAGPFVRVATLEFQSISPPIACLDDGSSTGVLVLGSNGLAAQPFIYGTIGGELTLEMESVSEAVVGAESASWGAMKHRFR
jgi:hypothetical protein